MQAMIDVHKELKKRILKYERFYNLKGKGTEIKALRHQEKQDWLHEELHHRKIRKRKESALFTCILRPPMPSPFPNCSPIHGILYY